MKLLPILFLLPLTALAQVGDPCNPQLIISYDAAGNRIQRKEICDPGGANPNSGSGENFRMAGPASDSILLTVSPNPGEVFMIRLTGSDGEVRELGGEVRELAERQLDLFTPDGKHILSQPFDNQGHKLDLSAYPDGIYLLRVRSGGQLWEEKLVKRR